MVCKAVGTIPPGLCRGGNRLSVIIIRAVINHDDLVKIGGNQLHQVFLGSAQLQVMGTGSKKQTGLRWLPDSAVWIAVHRDEGYSRQDS